MKWLHFCDARNETYGYLNMMPTMLQSRGFASPSVPFLFLLLLCSGALRAQSKLAVKKSEMSFTSNAELELIKASSNKVQGLIDPSSNKFAFAVDIRSFQGFNSKLQQEHFNEKYMESDKYPQASFSGKIIEPIDFSADRTYDVRAKGELNIHGQKQTRIIKAKVTIDKGQVLVQTHFVVPLADHNISIPTIVSQKIATEIEIDFNATMALQ
jgi:polyisoprenoid-binding protein YceI